MNSTGIVGAGGVGKEVADLIIDGKSQQSLWAYDPLRFVRLHNNKKFLRDRMSEALGELSVLEIVFYDFKSINRNTQVQQKNNQYSSILDRFLNSINKILCLNASC